MRGLLLWIIFIAALSTVAVLLADMPGLMQVEWMGWRITLSTSLFVAFIGILLLIIVWVAGTLTQLRAWPERKRTHRALLRQQTGLKALTRAAASLAVSDADGAKKDIAKARRYLNDAPLALLMQAQLHEKQGESDKAAGIYHELSGHEETARLGLRGLLQSAEKNRDYARALAIAVEGMAQFPQDDALLAHALELMLREGEYAQAEALLGKFRTRWRLPREQRQHIVALLKLLKAQESETPDQLRLLARAHAMLPRHRHIALSYAQALLDAEDSKLRKLLHEQWYHFPSPPLTVIGLRWLALLPEAKRNKAARKLAKQAPNHLESHLLLAYEAQSRGEWLLAHEYAQQALELRESRRALQLLADIETELNGAEKAKPLYTRAASAPQEESWVCHACGYASELWQLTCPSCGATDSAELALPAQRIMHIEKL